MKSDSKANTLGQRAMKSVEWKTYRTRFLVQAKQLNSALSFVDHLGRTHCGRRGDYLVESSDGVISIAPRQIFEDIYVPISASESVVEDTLAQKQKMIAETRESGTGERQLEPLRLEKKRVSATKLPRRDASEKLCACPSNRLSIEALEIEEIDVRPIAKRPTASARDLRRDETSRVRRKMPQPAGDRAPSSRLGWM